MTNRSACRHDWRRREDLEQGQGTVVFVRTCSLCGRLEAKPGHKKFASDEDWIVINDGGNEAAS